MLASLSISTHWAAWALGSQGGSQAVNTSLPGLRLEPPSPTIAVGGPFYGTF